MQDQVNKVVQVHKLGNRSPDVQSPGFEVLFEHDLDVYEQDYSDEQACVDHCHVKVGCEVLLNVLLHGFGGPQVGRDVGVRNLGKYRVRSPLAFVENSRSLVFDYNFDKRWSLGDLKKSLRVRLVNTLFAHAAMVFGISHV